jgi:hypothetical protein
MSNHLIFDNWIIREGMDGRSDSKRVKWGKKRY